MFLVTVSLSAPPLTSPIVELGKGFGIEPGVMTPVFAKWLRALTDRAEATSEAVKTISLSGQTASIALTSLLASASGLYRVSYRFRVTTAAGVSSSLQVTVTTTEGGVTCNQSSAAYTGNAVNSPQSGSFIVKADASSPISYSVTYASNPAAAAIFDLDLRLDRL